MVLPCTDDLTLYIYADSEENWIPAAPPVSLDGVESAIDDLNTYVSTINQRTVATQFQLDQDRELVRWDQERQDGQIATLEEEIEQLAPSLERGSGLYNRRKSRTWRIHNHSQE